MSSHLPDLSHVTDEDLIRELIRRIGDNPDRAGLRETPMRIVKAWRELYEGYRNLKLNPAGDILKTFPGEAIRHDEIILLRNVEFFSTCEHHMLPFFGQAHVAYIPGEEGDILGVSKLARIVDHFSRRLQIQERIGKQVVMSIMKYGKAAGAACVLEAEHLCMRMRGVGKQNSVMVTSALQGAFKDDSATRQELMMLIFNGRKF